MARALRTALHCTAFDPPLPFGSPFLIWPPLPSPCRALLPPLQTVASRDGNVCYTVFDPCAVAISVEEGQGGRRALVLRLVPREQLAQAELVH